MKKVELTQGQFALVDDEDFDLVNRHKWNVTTQKHTSYASRAVKKNGKWTTEYMHRLIMGSPKGLDIDHISRDGLDNRRSNMRSCTRGQNLRRRIPFGKSKYKGIYWCDTKKRWRAQIMVDGKRQSLGSYADEIEAAKAYDRAAIRMNGRFAYINFNRDVA